MRVTLVVLSILGTSWAATHVNISIAQQPATDLKARADTDDNPAPNSSMEQRFGRLQAAPDDKNSETSTEKSSDDKKQPTSQEPRDNGNNVSDSQSHFRQQSVYNLRGRSRGFTPFRPQTSSQLRKQNQQARQNQEFERYIQNYHSGPTVETVYESPNPSPQRYTHFSEPSNFDSYSSEDVVDIAGNSRMMHTFERQVALPAIPPNHLPATEGDHPAQGILSHQSKPITESPVPISSSGGSIATPGTGNIHIDIHQSGPTNFDQPKYDLPGYDQAKYDQSMYEQPKYDSPVYDPTKYDQSNYDQPKYDQPKYDDQSNYDQPKYDQPKYDQPKYDQRKYDQPKYDNPTYDQPRYDLPAYDPPKYDQPKFDQPKYKAQAYDQPRYDTPAYDQTKYDQSNYEQPKYDPPRYDQPKYFQPKYDQPKYNLPNSDQGSYDPNSNVKPIYEQANSPDLYVPNVDEEQSGYGNFAGPRTQYNNERSDRGQFYYPGGQTGQAGQAGQTAQAGYLPPHPSYQRPIVTKTIQIAQPALKAKKYEIRHPAIQKEFYDIEERVVIKPAGTIVVELERPVAKIPKGETILPLGHPHPAVAAAYNTNSQSSIVQTQPSDTTNIHPSTQIPQQPRYNIGHAEFGAKPGPSGEHSSMGATTIGSTITSTPTAYDHEAGKSDYIENKLKQAYIPTNERVYDEQKPISSDDFLVPTVEPAQNQMQISTKKLSPHMIVRDEPDFRSNFGHAQSRPAPHFATNYNSADNQYRSELLTGESFGNNFNTQQDFKPARLQEFPKSQKPAGAQSTAGRDRDQGVTIESARNEHNIYLPPMQHKIVLSRLGPQGATSDSSGRDQPATPALARFRARPQFDEDDNSKEERTARVTELKPFLMRHQSPVVVYATTSVRASSQQPSAQYRKPPGQARINEAPARVDYSPPYSQMRHVSSQSARLISATDLQNDGKDAAPVVTKENVPAQTAETSRTHTHTHIQIQIPQQPQEADKPIVISSTIGPMPKSEGTTTARPMPSRSPYVSDNLHQFHDDAETLKGADPEAGREPCEHSPQRASARYEQAPLKPQRQRGRGQEQFMRIQEPKEATKVAGNEDGAPLTPVTNIPSDGVELNLKSGSGHMDVPSMAGSRVIAATPAPTDPSSSSESFHKRRIVVNHPFQTVREVVEHEPITNYHQIQVNEPAPPSLYHAAAYYQPRTSHQYHHETRHTITGNSQ